jgi:hypothetical protein
MYCGPFGEDSLALRAPVAEKAQPKSPVLLSVYLVLFELWQESRSAIEGGLGSSLTHTLDTHNVDDCSGYKLKHFFLFNFNF